MVFLGRFELEVKIIIEITFRCVKSMCFPAIINGVNMTREEKGPRYPALKH